MGEHNVLQFWDYVVVGVFFAVMIGIGAFFARNGKSTEKFFGADKSVPWWLAGVSFYMCSFSALAFVMYSALAYKYGFIAATINWFTAPTVMIGAKLFAAKWRRAAQTSPLDFIESRYSNTMRQGLMWLGLPMRVLDDAFKMFAIGTVVGVGMGFPIEWAICVSAVIIIAYTFLGGLKAALVADFVQFLVIVTVVFALPYFCLKYCGDPANGQATLTAGWDSFMAAAKKIEGFFDCMNSKYTAFYLVTFWLVCFLNNATSWSFVQRYYTARSESDARKVGYLVGILEIIFPPLFFLPAMLARTFLPELQGAEVDGVYALVCTKVLPVGLVGMVIAAMFSATMSTLAGDFTAISSIVTKDFYARLVNPNASQRNQMLVARFATVGAGAIVIGLTFLMMSVKGADDLFNTVNKIFGVFVPPVAIPILAGLLFRRVKARAGAVALFGGIVVGVIAFVLGGYEPFASWKVREMSVMFCITAPATLALLVGASLLLKDPPEKERELDAFFKKVNTPA